jgi:hypothetical protein
MHLSFFFLKDRQNSLSGRAARIYNFCQLQDAVITKQDHILLILRYIVTTKEDNLIFPTMCSTGGSRIGPLQRPEAKGHTFVGALLLEFLILIFFNVHS